MQAKLAKHTQENRVIGLVIAPSKGIRPSLRPPLAHPCIGVRLHCSCIPRAFRMHYACITLALPSPLPNRSLGGRKEQHFRVCGVSEMWGSRGRKSRTSSMDTNGYMGFMPLVYHDMRRPYAIRTSERWSGPWALVSVIRSDSGALVPLLLTPYSSHAQTIKLYFRIINETDTSIKCQWIRLSFHWKFATWTHENRQIEILILAPAGQRSRTVWWSYSLLFRTNGFYHKMTEYRMAIRVSNERVGW